MPARFHPVSPSVWDKRLRRASREAQVVALYCWTCRQRNSEGLFELAPHHVAGDTGIPEDEVLAAFAELDQLGLFAYDEDAEVVLDRRALKDNPLNHGARDPATGELRMGRDGKPARNRRMGPAVARVADVPETPAEGGAVPPGRRAQPGLRRGAWPPGPLADLRPVPLQPLST